MITDREREILHILSKDPFIQQQDIATLLNISRSSVAGHIMNLTKKGYIKGKGYILPRHNYVVTVGSANMDICGYTQSPLVFEDSNLGVIKCTPGGVGRNIAQNIALLGYESHLISVLGRDFYGNTLFDQLKVSGVNIKHTHLLHGKNTSTYLSLIDDKGEMKVAVNDMSIIDELSPSLLIKSKDLIKHAGVVVIDCNLTEESIAWLLSNSTNAPIFVDTVSVFKAPKIRNLLSYIHTLKPNKFEAEILSGISIKTSKDILSVIDWFHYQGVRRLILSMGKKGVHYSEIDGQRGWSKALNVNVINVTGAGDAMMAGLVAGWLEGQSLVDSIKFAQGCSALTISSEYTNAPNLSHDRVYKLMESQ